MQVVLAIIGYVCTATVISAALCFGYLWSSERLDEEKVFRIVALMHDVDIEQLAEEGASEVSETPVEESSPADWEREREILARNFEVKQEALRRGRKQFDQSYERVKELMARFEQYAEDFDRKLRQDGELSSKENIAKVVRDLEAIKPEQSKNLLRQTLKQPEGVEDVVLLMNSMSTAKLKKILQKFQTPEELNDLHMIHEFMLKRGPNTEVLLNELNAERLGDL